MALAIVTAALLSACAGIMEPHIDRPFKAAVPLPPARKLSADPKPSPEHARMIALFDGEYRFPAAERYLNDILVKLAEAGEPGNDPYKVTILNTPVVNAFALPPNSLYVTRGLLALANDAAEVAAVMAHEIAHITARHAVQREEEEKRAAVISQAASVIQSRRKSEEVEAVARRSIASFSRQQELEADQIGIRVIARAGFDPYGAARFLAALGRSTALESSLVGQGTNAGKPDFLATHPSTPERVTLATNAARQIGAPGIGVSERASYLAAIDGMTFGDDPAEGAIRGRKYLHGRLGFAFLAPESFALESSSQAVLGVGEGGKEALRLDSVNVPAATPLATYLASGWIDGLIESSIESTTVNTMQAATANARAGEWSFRLAVIRFEPTEVYRLIFATKILDGTAEERFRASIQSFHRVNQDEIKAMRPFRIGVVVARNGDTLESVAARMAAPGRALDVFLRINGLESGSRLEAKGYKIVVE